LFIRTTNLLSKPQQDCTCDIPLHEMSSRTRTTTTNMNDEGSPPKSQTRSAAGTRKSTPLSISTFRPSTWGRSSHSSQSPAVRSAPPQPAPARTVSDPYPSASFSQRDTPTRSSSGEVPKSASHVDKSLRFEKECQKSPSAKTAAGDKIKRRHSHEPKINVYTECGRHSDDWLFGGFSVSDSFRKLLDRDRKD